MNAFGLAPRGMTAQQAAEQLQLRGATPHLADTGSARTRLAVLDALGAALSFPDYYGRNLDALYDLLTDLSWLPAGEHVLVWSGSKAFAAADPESFAAVREVLGDAASSTRERQDGPRLSVLFTQD